MTNEILLYLKFINSQIRFRLTSPICKDGVFCLCLLHEQLGKTIINARYYFAFSVVGYYINSMNIIQKIKAKTPKRQKRIGKIATVIGTACATVLSLGLVANPIGIVALTIGAVAFGGKALHSAIQVEPLKSEDESK